MDRPQTILYIDDDRDDQQIFVEALKELRPSVKCQIAEDGMQALLLLRKMEAPICIYLDINMPIMNGIEVLRKIKADPKLKAIPTFMLTTARLPNTETEARALGATDYLIKPNSYVEFKKLLDGCLLAHVG